MRMSGTKYSPNWKLSSIDPEGITVISGGGVDRMLVARFKRTEDAQRAVACENACEGLDDPAELRAQRDQLLRACKRILEHAEPCNCDEYDDCDHPIDADGNPMRLSASDYSALPQIIAAIARAEGRTK